VAEEAVEAAETVAATAEGMVEAMEVVTATAVAEEMAVGMVEETDTDHAPQSLAKIPFRTSDLLNGRGLSEVASLETNPDLPPLF
jgi:hypothetical protein